MAVNGRASTRMSYITILGCRRASSLFPLLSNENPGAREIAGVGFFIIKARETIRYGVAEMIEMAIKSAFPNSRTRMR